MTPLSPNSIPNFSSNLGVSKEKIDLFSLPKTLVPGKNPIEDIGTFLIEKSLKDEKLASVLKKIPLDHPLHDSFRKLALSVIFHALVQAIKKEPPLPRRSP